MTWFSKLAHRKWWFSLFSIVAATAFMVIAGPRSLWPLITGWLIPVAPCDANSRFVVDETGKRFLYARWPLGREDNLVWLHIPAEYVWRTTTGCVSAFGPKYQDPSVSGPYNDLVSFEVLLPDFVPKPAHERNKHTSGLDWSSMTILAYTLVRIPENKINIIGEDLDIHKEILLNPNSITLKDAHITIGPKPDRFGLKRIGAIADPSVFKSNEAMFADDVYFPDHKPIDMWIECQSEEVKDYTEEPGPEQRTPPCTQTFYSSTLDARVELTYRRIYLPRWREWQDKTEQFLRTLETSKAQEKQP